MSRTRRQPRKNAGNPTFTPKKTALAMAVGLALSCQMSSADAFNYVVTDLGADAGTAGTFPYALSQANESIDSDEISFQAGLTGTITLPDGVLIYTPIFIDGSSATVTITTNNSCPESTCSDLFTITSADGVTINGLTLDTGHSSYNQSLIEHNGAGVLTITDCSLLNSAGRTTAGDGGAINNTNGDLIIQNTVISGHQATGSGGAIAFSADDEGLQLQNSTVSNNVAGGGGGGIFLDDVEYATIETSTISGNMANGGEGGGVYFSPVDLASPIAFELDSSTLSNNTANNGGGLYIYLDGTDQAAIEISESVFIGNTASDGMGGGVATANEGTDAELNLLIDSSLFGENTALHRGGGLGVSGNSSTFVEVKNSSLILNLVNESSGADTGGGGLYMSGNSSTLFVVNSTIDDNSNVGMTPSGGGGVYLNSDGGGFGLTADFLNVTITRNTSSLGQGGGIAAAFAAEDGSLTLVNSIVAGNDAAASGSDDIFSAETQIDYSLIGKKGRTNLIKLTPGSNIVGTKTAPAKPLLASLDDNGGTGIGPLGNIPLPTRKVRKGSPVIGAGDATPASSLQVMPLTDQRGDGFVRIRGSRPEMGAIEYIKQ